MSRLVRDKVPEAIRASGEVPMIRVAGAGEYRGLLLAKLLEEARELAESSDPAELADVLEVVMALADCLGTGWHGLEELRREKLAARGGFAQRIVWLGNRPGP